MFRHKAGPAARAPLPDQAEEGFDPALCLLEDIIRWAPGARPAEHDDRRAAECEIRLLLASPERAVDRVRLHHTPNCQRADFDEGYPSEMFCSKMRMLRSFRKRISALERSAF